MNLAKKLRNMKYNYSVLHSEDKLTISNFVTVTFYYVFQLKVK